MPRIHCARGPNGCDKCKELADLDEEEGMQLSLARVYLVPGEIARPMTEIIINGKKILAEYDITQRFKNLEEAKNYAKLNSIDVFSNDE